MESFCFCRLPHGGLPQPLLRHPVLHSCAQPNPHLLREVSTGWLFAAAVPLRREVRPWRSLFFSQGNRTELCRNCKDTYRRLNEIYAQKEKNQTMCIDIEDSVSWISREGETHHLEGLGQEKLFSHPLNVASQPDCENLRSLHIWFSLCQWNSYHASPWMLDNISTKIWTKINTTSIEVLLSFQQFHSPPKQIFPLKLKKQIFGIFFSGLPPHKMSFKNSALSLFLNNISAMWPAIGPETWRFQKNNKK